MVSKTAKLNEPCPICGRVIKRTDGRSAICPKGHHSVLRDGPVSYGRQRVSDGRYDGAG